MRVSKCAGTVRLALATDGPWVRRASTMGANPAQAARCSGEEPFSSAALHDASYVSSSSTMCLKRWKKVEGKLLFHDHIVDNQVLY